MQNSTAAEKRRVLQLPLELSLALKYLVPRRKSLSTTLISALSIAVISLVVWLVLVFLSVTAGMERNWLKKLTALHAPIRLSPTQDYFHSYFYQIDALASASNYTCKTIGEKYKSPLSDPYSPEADPEVPPYWPQADRLSDGALRDPVKVAFAALSHLQKEIPSLSFEDYEMGGALMRLFLRSSASLSQMSYLLSIPPENPHLRSLILPPEKGAILDFEEEPAAPPPHVYFVQGKLRLPSFGAEAPVLLPKNYRDNGVEWGDRGELLYQAPAAASFQEQKIPIRVAGFYDPGVMAVGNKCLLVPREVTQTIYGASQTFSPDGTPTNGIFVWNPDLASAREIQTKIAERLNAAGVGAYWKVENY